MDVKAIKSEVALEELKIYYVNELRTMLHLRYVQGEIDKLKSDEGEDAMKKERHEAAMETGRGELDTLKTKIALLEQLVKEYPTL